MFREIGSALLVFLAWIMLSGTIVLLPPMGGAVWALILSALLVVVHVWLPAKRGQVDKLAALRAWALPHGRGWIASTLLLMPPLAMSLVAATQSMFPAMERPPDIFDTYAEDGGWVAASLVTILLAPILEEFFCRGWLQKTLERRLSPALAIGIVAALFAGLHGTAEGFSLFFGIGALFGWAVWWANSIWAGVLLHGTYNATLVAAGVLEDHDVGPFADPMVVQGGALAILLLTCAGLAAALVFALRRLPAPEGDGQGRSAEGMPESVLLDGA